MCIENNNLPSIKDVGEGINEGSKGFVRLFSGMPRRSEINTELKASKDILDAVTSIRAQGIEQGWPDDLIDGLCRDTIDRIGKIENYQKVLSFAAPRIEPDADPESLVGSTWINYFRDHSEKVTEEDVQQVWGAILAEEVNMPGSVSKRTMSVLSDMGKTEIDWFVDVCSKSCVNLRESLDCITGDAFLLADKFSSQEHLFDLMGLGLIQLGDNKISVEPRDELCLRVGDKLVVAKNNSDVRKSIKGRLVLTLPGRELAKLCELEFGKDVRVVDILIDILKSAAFDVEVRKSFMSEQMVCGTSKTTSELEPSIEPLTGDDLEEVISGAIGEPSSIEGETLVLGR